MKPYKYLIIPTLLLAIQLTSCKNRNELFVIPPVEEGQPLYNYYRYLLDR